MLSEEVSTIDNATSSLEVSPLKTGFYGDLEGWGQERAGLKSLDSCPLLGAPVKTAVFYFL